MSGGLHSRPGVDFVVVLSLRPVLYSRGAPLLWEGTVFFLSYKGTSV